MYQWIWRKLSPSALVGAMVVSSVAHATAAGTTAGRFAVTPSGAAAYTIPIWAPPGPNHLQPSIALTYNSRGGNGYVGVGWGVSGISAIYRCNRTIAQDSAAAPVTLTSADGYCMDGQRLRLTGGTYGAAGSTYQTEIANFVNVAAYGTAGNGPAYWIATDSAGRKFSYGQGGTTSNAAVPASGTNFTDVSWQLNQVTDPAGNTMTVTYSTANANAQVVPKCISWVPVTWGSTSYNYTMTFSYTANGSVHGYLDGVAVNNTNVLSSIAIAYQGTPVKTYYLTYSNSSTATGRYLLTQVQECAGTGTSNCLAPTTAAYQAGSAGVGSAVALSGASGTVVSTAYDFNGDGRNDLLIRTSTGTMVAFGGNTGYGTPVAVTGITSGAALVGDIDGSGTDSLLWNNGGTWYYYKWNGSSFVGASTGVAMLATSGSTFADVNGDGRADIIQAQSDGYVHVRLNTSAGGIVSFSSDINSMISLTQGLYSASASNRESHFWGSNKDNIIEAYQSCLAYHGSVCISYQNYHVEMDFTGSTFTDISGYSNTSTSPGVSLGAVDIADYNDDGCTDILTSTQLLLSGCNGSAPVTVAIPSGFTAVGGMDWNGDGRRDVLVSQSNGYIGVLLSTATGLSGTAMNTSIAYTGGSSYIGAPNPTGDAQDALVVGSNTGAITYYLHSSLGAPPDLLNSITDGYGVNASPTYVSISRSNYTETSTAAYPDSSYPGPYYVVNQYSATSPASTAGTYTKSYTYTDAHLNMQGRGFMGFTTQQAVDSRTLLAETLTYNLTFPTTGLLIGDAVLQNSGTGATVVNATKIPVVTTLNSTAGAQRYFPYIASQTRNQYEVGGAGNGQLITTTATSYILDSYGNPTEVSNTVTDEDSGSPYYGQSWTTVTTNTPSADTTHWCLNLLTQTQTAYSASNGSNPVTRTKGLTPDTTNCRYIQIVTEPSSSAYKVTEVFGYDSFSNVNSDAVTGIGMAARTTTASWGTTGQFPMSITDPSGASTQLNYNFSFGVPSSITDANGLGVSWQYGDGFGRKTQENRPDGTYAMWTYSDMTSAGYSFRGLFAARDTYGVGAIHISNDEWGYDSADHLVVEVHDSLSGGHNQLNLKYDSLGRAASRSAPCTWTGWPTVCSYWTTTSYDVLNRITQVQRPISASNSTLQTTGYVYLGRTRTITDPQGKITTLINDVNGWARQTKDAVGYAVTTAYDSAGSPTAVTDSSGNNLWYNASYAYGVAPFLLGATDMDMGAWAYTVDALGERTGWKDAKNQTFSESFDVLGRPLTRTDPDLFTNWTWGSSASAHNIGQLQSVCTGSGGACLASGYSEAETYDSLGRPSQRAITIPAYGTFTYSRAYDATTGLLKTLTYPVSTAGYALQLQYGYQGGLLQSVTDVSDSPSVTVWTANSANAAGQVTQETLGNGIVTNRAYDAVTGWLASVQSGMGSGAGVQNQSFLYDEMGNLTQRQDGNRGLTENAYYDADYRLTSTNLNGSQDFSVSYDAMGNITSRSDVGAGATWTYDPVHKHQATNIAGIGLTYVYDGNGNVTTRGGSPITWSSYNYPTAITVASPAGSESVSLSYGPDRSRWQQQYSSVGFQNASTTNYIGSLLEQVNSGGIATWRHYIYAGNEPVAVYSRTSSGTNAFNYFLSDHQGSVAAITANNGSTVVAESNTPFGVRRNPATWGDPAVTATGWTGQISNADMDASEAITQQGYTFQTGLGEFMGLNHMNGRVQDAISGRFLSADPNIPDPSFAQSYNRYSYVNNNPLTGVDPSGFADKCKGDFGCGGDSDGGASGGDAAGSSGSAQDPYIRPLTGTMIPGVVPDGFNCAGDCSLSGLTGLSQTQIRQIFGGSSTNANPSAGSQSSGDSQPTSGCYYVLSNPCGGASSSKNSATAAIPPFLQWQGPQEPALVSPNWIFVLPFAPAAGAALVDSGAGLITAANSSRAAPAAAAALLFMQTGPTAFQKAGMAIETAETEIQLIWQEGTAESNAGWLEAEALYRRLISGW